jgi:uncharacterized phiE125 gp8 family phage protein
LNIGADVSNDVLSAFISAARFGVDGVDGWLGRAIITQTCQLALDGFFPPFRHRQPRHHEHEILIPLPPLQDINSITYIDGTGTMVTLDDADYDIIQDQRPFIVSAYGKARPSARLQPISVTIEFVAGYGDAGSDVPEPIPAAIALEINRLRSPSTRDQNLMVTVSSASVQTYAVGRDGGVDMLSAALQALIVNYRVIT